jgi:malic enzyme
VVVNGAGASALACTALIKSMGVRHDNVTVCDRSGVIYRGREGGMTSSRAPTRSTPMRARWKTRWTARTCSSACRRRRD